MGGALAERVFAHKITKTGFADLQVVDRRPFSVDEAAHYPMFTPDLIALMRELLPADKHDDLATVITVVARKPNAPEDEEPR